MNRKNSGGDGSLGEAGDGIEGNISMEEPSAARRRGFKKRKLEEKVENGAQRVARSVDKMALALESAARDMRKAASLGLQLEN